MVRLVISADGKDAYEGWRASFAEIAPDIEVCPWAGSKTDLAGVDYALVWQPGPGELAKMGNLRGILCTGAGINHLLRDPDFPHHVPLVRMGGEETCTLMADYVQWAAIGLIRDARTWARNQATGTWRNNPVFRTSAATRIGIMGYGNLGSAVARHLARTGFQVSAWCRTLREAGETALFAGQDRLPAFLGQTDILVNLLPSTQETRNLIDFAFLSLLPRGTGLINVGRGDQVVEVDLLRALDENQLSGAVLDVFVQEPLPDTSPFWSHPKITVTPHVASEASRPAQTEYVAKAIRQMEAGETPPLLYKPGRGY
ncbi:2-hydroxyacid dehydrogenase [Acetobacter oeni]|uniref:Glyoxylate/hydroxypyruvate reductase A n=1 Tax=Acetobacter oeni TaxID=304077 RepID=A0A511XHG8_9PROT|nr:glyoxylate/hydroxypyruvate reductase A [Acetobacter oeni]MBB3881243.1 glyoxylate/hydroxypyruvate reductase A [Acetobacter oeni]NHO18118.1 glyoxylate/hydroxypyruvate reductase A [Acetobacter oeni]GBR08243.1 D-isomer specific 2-hydroxyacid dehydrogenase [Acetobacter oeni LMG 21952]GEN62395.1 glyoxylate/hydroxypyruvate reductase A [Acetobacter oeni]